ncbi:restriction endonuclease [Cellvibrio fibrivorans]|uniref:Restriction endonuclease type IV Mrr domain-containing protein n=1 Tax=Cellvibrio fibrivorans TaxID=126350 RepID=A0ABU1UTU8_9GAMM|nr:restriction endonuclease [Cellvibrio fibrivorans]MDR7088598.1 hypothetical protein [Cellvibrio fibrivorans]
MSFEIEKLSSEFFELLCAKLLQAEGYIVQELEHRGRDIGIDLELRDQNNQKIAVEVKIFRRPRTSTRYLKDVASQLKRGADLIKADRMLLIISMVLPGHILKDIQSLGVEVKDSRWIRNALANSPDIENEFENLVMAQESIKSSLNQSVQVDQRARELIESLKKLDCGRAKWNDYENICIDILNYLFFPSFKVPKVQSRSEDGLDRRDAVYPIGNGHAFWDELKRDSHSRFAVAEFKNLCEAPTQKEVESIQQYLFVKAKRMFGILCCRHSPSQSALKAKRRAWIEFDKLIVILSDDDMIDMLNMKGGGEDPAEVIDSQLEEFWLELTP